MKTLVAVVAVLAVVANAQSVTDALEDMTTCGWKCLPVAAEGAQCSPSDLSCLCWDDPALFASTIRVDFTGCQEEMAGCGTYGDATFDLGDAMDKACEAYIGKTPSSEEQKEINDYINEHIEAAKNGVGASKPSVPVPETPATTSVAKADPPAATTKPAGSSESSRAPEPSKSAATSSSSQSTPISAPTAGGSSTAGPVVGLVAAVAIAALLV